MSTYPSTPLVADLDPARAGSQARPDALAKLDALTAEDINRIGEALGELARVLLAGMQAVSRLCATMPTTTEAGVGPGLGEERAHAAPDERAVAPATPVVPAPREAAAVSGFSAAASSTKGTDSSVRELVFAAVRDAGRAMSSSEVVSAVGLGKTTTVGELAALVDEGRVFRSGNSWRRRYAMTQAEADAGSAAVRLPTLAEARPNLMGQGAEDRHDADRRPLGASTAPLTAVDALPPTVDEAVDDVDQVDEADKLAPVEQPTPVLTLRPRDDAARRALLARSIPLPAPGKARGALTEPPKRPRSFG